jgi:hypothetical protein
MKNLKETNYVTFKILNSLSSSNQDFHRQSNENPIHRVFQVQRYYR